MSSPPGRPSRRGRGVSEVERGRGGEAGGAGRGRGSGSGAGESGEGSGRGSNAAGEAALSFWETRRAAWLAPQTSSPTLTSSAPAPPPRARQARILPSLPHAHPGRQRLEHLLSVDNAEADEGIWSSIRQVWQRLTAGTQLTTPLPLSMVVRILRGGWIRDGTWPLTADGPAQVAEEEGEETNGHPHNGSGNGGGGHAQAAEQLPAVLDQMEEEGTTETATEISEGTVLSQQEAGGSARPNAER
ncbi:hypothetical protein CALVIDRAFT_525104 [Calocera viscosa TUFC12733]|uniref:Gag1-like clamp domain-containing protein n=1 Tax=Calocera viscosa (strain TUFC12733) TaxID=1330018 RepID=A0A167QTY5_CALVF|nr:hypothetical protein CALVIDRAFT_525104 [Calocera viscosa TUFC12733]